MILAAHEAPYTLIIEQEDDPPNPRVEWDTFGKMICWHRRYSLGDKHDFDSPEDFLRDLYRHSITDGGKQLVSFLKSGKARASKLEYNPHTREWDLSCYSYWRTILGNSEPDWYVEQSAPKSQLNDDGWFMDYMLDALTTNDLKELLGELKDVVILPLFLYDHSGLSISTGSFVGRAVHAEWDSGQVGYIYADRKAIEKTYGAVNSETLRQAGKVLEGEVECYDLYLRGECYGYRLFKDGEEEDSCWGFLREYPDVLKWISSSLPSECQRLIEKLESKYCSAESYIENLNIA